MPELEDLVGEGREGELKGRAASLEVDVAEEVAVVAGEGDAVTAKGEEVAVFEDARAVDGNEEAIALASTTMWYRARDARWTSRRRTATTPWRRSSTRPSGPAARRIW